MTPNSALPLELVRRADRIDPLDDRRLRAQLHARVWVRVAPGSFAAAGEWDSLAPIERHRVLVLETARRMRPGATISHHSAAALWGIDVLGSWPTRVEVTIPLARGGRSSGLIVRHAVTGRMPRTVAFGTHRLTTPAQTAYDLARMLPHAKGVSVVDQAIWSDRRGGALTTRDDILALWEGSTQRGRSRALRAIEFAEPLAMNPRESHSRVMLAQLGFPPPLLQYRRVLRSGRVAFADFYFPTHDHWAELDGRGKYVSPEYGSHRGVTEMVLDEKQRENEIRREVRGFSRWEPSDADHPRRLYDILVGDGLPSGRPRP